MAHIRPAVTSAAAISIFMTGSAAFADVTAQDVWTDWKDYMAGFGYFVEAEENYSGDTLTVRDLSMQVALPEVEGTMTMSMGQFQFTDVGDGTVSMTIPAEMPILVVVDSPESENVRALVDYNTAGLSIVVSGDPEEMTYTYSAADITVALRELLIDDVPQEFGRASMTINTLAGSSEMTSGDLRSSKQRFTSGPVEFAVDFNDPEGPGKLKIDAGYDSLSFAGGGTFPKDMDPENMANMMAAGFAFDGTFDFGPGGGQFNFTEDSENVEAQSSTGGGRLNVAMGADGLAYSGEASDYNVQIKGGDLPFPVELAMQSAGFNLTMPVAKSDDVQDFALALSMNDFTMSEMIWGMFDASGQLPRDPATIAFDLTGKVKLLVDLMDPEAMVAVEENGETPGELNAVDLNNLTIRAAGAELTGEGGFTFDNSDLVTFDGMPAPTGSIDLKLVGGNGLLDKLVSMGFVQEQDAMGMRMMMSMFAVPGQGEDELTSKIEVSGDGQVKANGQRIR